MSESGNYSVRRRQAKNSVKISICRICGEQARIINYGALSCASCKTFFRRHGRTIQNISACQHDGHCKITLATRKLCVWCRWKKCLEVGMTPDLIRKEFHEKRSRSLMASRTKHSIQPQTSVVWPPKIQTLDLLNKDRSLLSTSDWRTLSNAVQAFDKFNYVRSVQTLIENLNNPQATVRIDSTQAFQLIASFFTSVQSFIESIPDFRVLTINEQSSLLQRNMLGVAVYFNTSILGAAEVYDSRRNASFALPMYDYEVVLQTKKIYYRMDQDLTLIKMLQLILTFSSCCHILIYDEKNKRDPFAKGTYRLFGSQDVYTEIIWKYLLYRYNEIEATLRFAGLVKTMLDLMTLLENVSKSTADHHTLMDHIIETAENTLTLKENDTMPLWGGAQSDILITN